MGAGAGCSHPCREWRNIPGWGQKALAAPLLVATEESTADAVFFYPPSIMCKVASDVRAKQQQQLFR